jgi:hypothetical protein
MLYSTITKLRLSSPVSTNTEPCSSIPHHYLAWRDRTLIYQNGTSLFCTYPYHYVTQQFLAHPSQYLMIRDCTKALPDFTLRYHYAAGLVSTLTILDSALRHRYAAGLVSTLSSLDLDTLYLYITIHTKHGNS